MSDHDNKCEVMLTPPDMNRIRLCLCKAQPIGRTNVGKYLADSYDAALRENADLKTRLDEAERDAERYRRLRVDPSLIVGPSYVLRRTDELDAAIDAAREGGK